MHPLQAELILYSIPSDAFEEDGGNEYDEDGLEDSAALEGTEE